ncbi:cyclic nucleotide-gated ion channel [Methylocystis sp. IM3]|uniref:cyclic nucleotide-gated ion channel n=1 Tax=unclassified Methylocystis TaxID=2625913 RepID=UPI0031196E9B
MTAEKRGWYYRTRRRTHLILDGGGHDWATRFVHRTLVVLVAFSVFAVVLESVPEYGHKYGPLFHAIEYVAVVAFTIEYLMRLWSAPDHTPYTDRTSTAARLAFIVSGSAIIDLLTILPFYLSLFIATDLRVMVLLRLLRFFKLARYSAGIRTLVAVMEAERKALVATGILLFGAVLFSASAIHIAEQDAQPEAFGTIPTAMWWAIVTITTVGYGDVTPVTVAGRMIASVTMVLGYVMLGLPVGIVATAFAEEIHRREFVVTWSMVASVPLFRTLGATAIAEIMRYLSAQSIPAGTLIVRRGDLAQSMYFIAEGEVEIELSREPARLGPGQFFGEMAILHKTLRTANVRAVEPTKLLVLDAYDLQSLIVRNPEIGDAIRDVAASRQELAPEAQHGDMIEAELARPADTTEGPACD